MKINVQAIVSMVQVCYDDATIQYLIVTINDNLYVASDIIESLSPIRLDKPESFIWQ